MKDLVLEEYYTIRELRFTCRQMIWIGERLYEIRLGDWPVKPSGHIEADQDNVTRPGARKNARINQKTLKTRSARFERAAQIAAEIDWRLNQCRTRHGDYGALFLDKYMRGLSFEETAQRHGLTAEIVASRIDQVLRYISGWRRKNLSLEHYKQHRIKGYGQRK